MSLNRSVKIIEQIRRIQHNASERQLKICRLLLHSIVSLTAKQNFEFHLTPKSGQSEGCIGIILKASVMSALANQAPWPANLIMA